MKLTKYLPMVALAALAATSCSEEPQLPPVKGPQATYESNTSILELKQQFWQTESNYVSTVGLNEQGDSIIIHGTVISSDETGNIFKSIMINDGTSAITVAINAYDLYQSYQYGQEVFINVTGLHIGRYNNLMQLGGEGTYNGEPSMTFMAEASMTAHAQQNGLGSAANAEKYLVETDIPTLMEAKKSAEGLQNWQSQLIRIDGLSFEDAGSQFAPTATTNRYLRDEAGNRINLRCSSYADFAKDVIPSGTGSVTAILSYFGPDWQMLLINLDGLQGFEPVVLPEEVAYTPATEVVSGGQYAIWLDGRVATEMPGSAYSYLNTIAGVQPDENGNIKTYDTYAYTFVETPQGWTIQDSHGTYLYMEGTYTSFQLSKQLQADNPNFYWTITPNAEGRFEIVNAGNDCMIQYYADKNNYGAYTDRDRGPLPYLYQLAK